MATKSVSFDWCRDLVQTNAVNADRRWVLTAMDHHGESLVALLWRILGNEQDVCDAYQETFLKLTHCETDVRPDNIKAYLFRSANNVAVSMLRRKKRFAKACQQWAQNTAPEHKTDYLADLDTYELQQRLRFHITQLPSYLRNVIILHDLVELTYQQVVKILGISAATARVYRCRAIRWLAARLTDKKET